MHGYIYLSKKDLQERMFHAKDFVHLEDKRGFLSQAWNIFDIFNEFLYRGLPGQSLGRKQLTARVRLLVEMAKIRRKLW